jgi:hypothetical protein
VDAAAGTYFMGRRPAGVAAEPVLTTQKQASHEEAQYQGLIESDVRAYR